MVDGVTGIFFPERSASSLIEAVSRFETTFKNFDTGAIARTAHKFNKIHVKDEFYKICGRLNQNDWRHRAASHLFLMPPCCNVSYGTWNEETGDQLLMYSPLMVRTLQ